MVDLEIVRSRLATLTEMLSILKRHQKLSLKAYLEDRERQLVIEHALLVGIQSILDLATHVLADSDVRDISDYRDALLKLARIKVLPSHFSEQIADMAGFRNLLIHEYQEINPQKVHQFLTQRLTDFEEFIRYLRDHFRLA